MFRLVFFREENGSTPFIGWFRKLPAKAQDRCRTRLERLRERGHRLRRPEADYLRDGIYELRVRSEGTQYRMLYFFHGREAVVVSHGIIKSRAAVPPMEIDRAIARMRVFVASPGRHTHQLGERT